MTINIFVLKGDLNGKIVVVRFFFCRVYFLLYICCSNSMDWHAHWHLKWNWKKIICFTMCFPMKLFKYKMLLRNALNSYANNNSKSVKINEQSDQHHWYCFYDSVTQSHLHCIYYWNSQSRLVITFRITHTIIRQWGQYDLGDLAYVAGINFLWISICILLNYNNNNHAFMKKKL